LSPTTDSSADEPAAVAAPTMPQAATINFDCTGNHSDSESLSSGSSIELLELIDDFLGSSKSSITANLAENGVSLPALDAEGEHSMDERLGNTGTELLDGDEHALDCAGRAFEEHLSDDGAPVGFENSEQDKVIEVSHLDELSLLLASSKVSVGEDNELSMTDNDTNTVQKDMQPLVGSFGDCVETVFYVQENTVNSIDSNNGEVSTDEHQDEWNPAADLEMCCQTVNSQQVSADNAEMETG
jgi:hypothetical protein